jgi:HEPN domain-containing protein
MPREASRYAGDGLRLAERDGARVGRLLDQDDPAQAGCCLQQAVEKFLKAFLLSQGWQLKRIHHLDVLLDDAVTYDASQENFRSVCQKITAFYFVERYPFVIDTGITVEDVRSAFEQVKGLIEKLRRGK